MAELLLWRRLVLDGAESLVTAEMTALAAIKLRAEKPKPTSAHNLHAMFGTSRPAATPRPPGIPDDDPRVVEGIWS